MKRELIYDESGSQENSHPVMNIIQGDVTKFKKTPDSYFVGRNENSKVKRIAQRIEEIAKTADPNMRHRVLNEATVKYNDQTMTL